MHLAITPIQHQNTSLFKDAFKPTPTAMLIGAPTVKVQKNPSPITPNLSHIL